MSIIPVVQGDLETFSVITNPLRTYSSSSQGVTGSVYVFSRRSQREKDLAPSPSFIDSTYDDEDINVFLQECVSAGKIAKQYTDSGAEGIEYAENATKKFGSLMSQYLDKINKQGTSARKFKFVDVIRFTPTTRFTSNTVRKLVVKDVLNSYYKTRQPSANWAYTNYNTLNFFKSETVPDSSALLYPNVEGPSVTRHEGYVTGAYSLSGSFSFDFYINPRYQQAEIDSEFKAGTIFHLSSSYALSLISGSAKDQNGRATGFMLQLQLSHSADISPSQANQGVFPRDLVFRSNDNSLKLNNWHHVVVRWGTNLINGGSGSFNIDGVDVGDIVIPSGTISPKLFNISTSDQPSVLCVGNYWEGRNYGASAQSTFFAKDPADRDGLVVIEPSTGVEEPNSYVFAHPLSAELHDLSIKRYYMTDEDIRASAGLGPSQLDERIALYIPPFFTEESPFRKMVNDHGGVMQTPFFEINGSTNDPFNVAMSFGVNGHYINIENYVRDFANNSYPRLHHMTGSVITDSTQALEANDHLYGDPFVRRRNLLILPCDDGKFFPDYRLLGNEVRQNMFVNDEKVIDFSLVSLNDLLSTSSLIFGTTFSDVEGQSLISDDLPEELIGPTPENPEKPPGEAFLNYQRLVNYNVSAGAYDPGIHSSAPLTIYQRTLDPSSNQVTFFDISNLFYGKQIKPGSFVISDSNITGSGGAIKMTLRDDGLGNIYRADCKTPASKWNSCGNIYYSEGIVVIKNPHLYFFGKNDFDISFRGEQNIHTLKLEVIAASNTLNSSSNPGFIQLPASGIETDTDPNYVYITGLNFHDENLNVVAKTQLAQPIVKRHGDRIMFKVTLDL